MIDITERQDPRLMAVAALAIFGAAMAIIVFTFLNPDPVWYEMDMDDGTVVFCKGEPGAGESWQVFDLDDCRVGVGR